MLSWKQERMQTWEHTVWKCLNRGTKALMPCITLSYKHCPRTSTTIVGLKHSRKTGKGAGMEPVITGYLFSVARWVQILHWHITAILCAVAVTAPKTLSHLLEYQSRFTKQLAFCRSISTLLCHPLTHCFHHYLLLMLISGCQLPLLTPVSLFSHELQPNVSHPVW